MNTLCWYVDRQTNTLFIMSIYLGININHIYIYIYLHNKEISKHCSSQDCWNLKFVSVFISLLAFSVLLNCFYLSYVCHTHVYSLTMQPPWRSKAVISFVLYTKVTISVIWILVRFFPLSKGIYPNLSIANTKAMNIINWISQKYKTFILQRITSKP